MSTSNLEIKIKALVEGLDGITKLTESLTRTSKEAENLATGTDSAGSALSTMAQKVSSAEDNLASVGDTVNELANDLGSIAKTAATTGEDLKQVGADAAVAETQLKEMAVGTQDAAKGLQDVSKATKDSSVAMADSAGATTEQTSRFKVLVTQIQDLVAKLRLSSSEQTKTSSENKRSESSFSTLGQKIREVVTGQTDLTKSTTSAVDGLTKVRAGSGAAAEMMGTLISVAKPLAIALMAVAGVELTFDYLKEAAQYAAKVQTLGTTLGVVGTNAGYTKSEMAEFEKTLKQTGISTEAARNGMIQMMQAGLPLGVQAGQTKSQIEQLARAAQDLAVVTGENSSDTMQRLITNIQQMDSMGMRFMGLSVDMESAQQKYANSIKTTAGALTDAQKRQAVFNEAMAQAQKLAGSYEAAMEDVGKKVGSLKRYSDELSNSMGSKLLPIYASLVDGATSLMKSLNAQTEAFDAANEHGTEFGAGVSAVLDPLVRIIADVYNWVLKLGMSFGPAFQYAGEILGNIIGAFADLFDLVDTGSGVVDGLSKAIEFLGGMLAVVADIVTGVRLGFNFLLLGVETSMKAIANWAADLAEFIGLPDALVAKFKEIAKGADDMGARTSKNIADITNKITEGDLATLEWARKFDELGTSAQALNPKMIDDFKEKIRELIRTQNEHKVSSEAVAGSYFKLKQELDKAKESGQLSEKEWATLNAKMSVVANTIKDELDASLKQLGTTTNELATGISEDTSVIIGALSKVKDNGLTTADQFAAAFSEKVTVAKNIQELNEFSKLLEQAKTRWPESANLFVDAQKQVAVQFDELYDKQLKAVTTTQQWDKLKASVVAMGDAGLLSGNQVEQALQKGEQQLNRMSPAFQSAADASKVLGQAVEQVEQKLSDLDTAINITATQAQEGYSRMSAGYSQLAAIMSAETETQLAVIDQRYSRELSLIDQSVMDNQTAERKKTDLLISSITDRLGVLDTGYVQEQAYLQKEEDATRSSLAVKLAVLNDETAKVEEVLGKNHANRQEYERKLVDLENQRKQMVYETETQIRQRKEDSLLRLRDKYVGYIDKLASEEDRRYQKVKDIESQINSLKLSAEDQLRQLEKQGMSDYEAYQANQTDVVTYQAKARAAAAQGEFDKAKEYLTMAKDAATELGQAVKEGDKELVSSTDGLANKKKALQDVFATQISLLEAEKAGWKAGAEEVKAFKETAVASLEGVNGSLNTLQTQAKTGIDVNITANNDQAVQKVKEVNDMVGQKEKLMTIRADLKDASAQVTKLMDDIEKGRTSKVAVDTTAANEALTQLFALANQTANPKLALDASNAIKALDDMDVKVKALDNVTTKQNHTIAVEDNGGLKKVEEINALDQKQTSQQHTINTNADEAEQKIYVITSQDGSVTYADHIIDTNAPAVTEELDIFHKTEDGRLSRSEVDIQTNADEAKAKIDAAVEKRDQTNKVDIETNADEAKQKVDAVTAPVAEVTNQVKIETNADEAGTEINEVLQPKEVSSWHTINTNATEQKPGIDSVLQKQDVVSTHNVTTNAQSEEVKAPLELALTQKDVASTHNITTNAKDVKPDIEFIQTHTASVTSTHNVATNAASVRAQIESLASLATRSMHTITTNVQAAMAQVLSMQGKNTFSYHTIYVVKQFLFAEGGEVGGSGTGSAMMAPKYHRMTSGTVGGAGNSDTEAKTLDTGSFVLRKSAVQKYGAANLLQFMEKAKQLPKAVSSAASGVVRALTMPGEIVVGKDTASRLGRGFLNALNGGSLPPQLLTGQPLMFATGGAVGAIPDPIGGSLSGLSGMSQSRSAEGGSQASMTVDLRGSRTSARVQTAVGEQENLLDLLDELRGRS